MFAIRKTWREVSTPSLGAPAMYDIRMMIPNHRIPSLKRTAMNETSEPSTWGVRKVELTDQGAHIGTQGLVHLNQLYNSKHEHDDVEDSLSCRQ